MQPDALKIIPYY